MRAFIQFSSGLFVVSGMLIVIMGVVAAVSPGSGRFGTAIGISSIIAAAGVTLVGGSAYMLCSIDKRIEKIAEMSSGLKQESKTSDAIF